MLTNETAKATDSYGLLCFNGMLDGTAVAFDMS